MVLRRASFVVLVLVVAGLLAGCPSLLMDFRVTLDPTEISVPQGGEGEISVTIGHLIPVDTVPMSITVEIHDPPDYLTSQPLTIPAGITTDELTFMVDAAAPLGGPVTVEVRASNGLKTKETTFQLTITSP